MRSQRRPRDAVLRPLVQIINGDGVPLPVPSEIDRLRGDGAGGRWILEPSDATLDASAITYCVARALEGASKIEAMPVHSCVEENEIPAVRINQFRPSRMKRSHFIARRHRCLYSDRYACLHVFIENYWYERILIGRKFKSK